MVDPPAMDDTSSCRFDPQHRSAGDEKALPPRPVAGAVVPDITLRDGRQAGGGRTARGSRRGVGTCPFEGVRQGCLAIHYVGPLGYV